MVVDIKVPSVGESVTEAVLAEWFKKDGDTVEKGEALFVLETDKVTLEVEAEAGGTLKIQVSEGETVKIGAVVGTIDSEGPTAEAPAAEAGESEKEPPRAEKAAAREKAPPDTDRKPSAAAKETPSKEKPAEKPSEEEAILSPSVRRLVAEKGLDVDRISGSGPGGRVTKSDVLLYLESLDAEERVARAKSEPQEAAAAPAAKEETTRKPMTPIRRRIAARLLEAKQSTAMLTTFNDIDMSRVMEIRSRYKEAFKKKYDVSLGFMSFFIKAGIEALKEFPEINAAVDGNEIVYHNYYHIGVAIGTGKGLVVPVIRHAQNLGMAQLEKAIVDYVQKIKDNRLELADLEGGTFTITNGGVFGSLLSTPILNTPQSGILGMHRIDKRPVVIDDEIVVRPMMYVALSYDHRIVDGREAVTFLRRIKEFVENPERMLVEI
jgi:2-oxoglutarate dehydrogenase E2 component (dihydrolipoamide succinyltransferase)